MKCLKKIKIKEIVEEETQRRQLIWYVHEGEIDQDWQYKSTCKEKKKNPRRTCIDGIKEAMEKRGIKRE